MGAAPALVDAVTTAGMSPKARGWYCAAGGAISGAVSAGMINPEDAGMGAVIGGVAPVAIKGVGMAAKKAGSALAGSVSDSGDPGKTS